MLLQEDGRDTPFVSVIIPCLNEETRIASCLESIVQSDFPKDRLEVLVVDGLSEDSTRLLVMGYADQYGFVRLLDNPRRIIPAAMNIGINHSVGEIVMKVDAHATYVPNYISACVRYLREFGADNVGGVARPVPGANGLVARAIALVLAHPFGVGNSRFRRGGDKPEWVDTVFGGCYWRRIFDRIGEYDESIAFSEDLVINAKLRRAGGKILLVPRIISNYFARPNLISFWVHSWRNGLWLLRPFKYTDVRFASPRHLAPLAFVGSLVALGALTVYSRTFLVGLILIFGSYGLATLLVSSILAMQHRQPALALMLPLVLIVLHVGYGLGSIFGLLELLAWRVKLAMRRVC